MKQLLTATCLAAVFATSLAAQSTSTTAQEPLPGGQRGGGPRTVTGCLRTGDTAGSYMLTDVMVQGGGRRGGDTTSTTASSTTGTTTTGTATTGTATTGTATTTDPQGGRGMTPQSVMLTAVSDVDLKPHVGHKIEVTGTMSAGGRRGGDTTTAGSTTTGTTSTGTSTGSTSTGTSASGGGGQGRSGPRSMTVTTVRMVSESCS